MNILVSPVRKRMILMSYRRLYRIEDGRVIFGVCGGVAEYFNIDPSIVRIVWAVLSLAWGAGLLAYIIAAIVVPKKSSIH
jgi:phage shock protein C